MDNNGKIIDQYPTGIPHPFHVLGLLAQFFPDFLGNIARNGAHLGGGRAVAYNEKICGGLVNPAQIYADYIDAFDVLDGVNDECVHLFGRDGWRFDFQCVQKRNFLGAKGKVVYEK